MRWTSRSFCVSRCAAASLARALAAPLGLDEHALCQVLDAPADAEALARDAAAYFRARSNTTMRVWQYWPGGMGNEAHTDNTLLTLSPPGTTTLQNCRFHTQTSTCPRSWAMRARTS